MGFEVLAAVVFALVVLAFLRLLLRGETVGWVRGDRDRIDARSRITVIVKRHVGADPRSPEVELQMRVVGSIKAVSWEPAYARLAADKLEEAARQVRRRTPR